MIWEIIKKVIVSGIISWIIWLISCLITNMRYKNIVTDLIINKYKQEEYEKQLSNITKRIANE